MDRTIPAFIEPQNMLPPPSGQGWGLKLRETSACPRCGKPSQEWQPHVWYKTDYDAMLSTYYYHWPEVTIKTRRAPRQRRHEPMNGDIPDEKTYVLIQEEVTAGYICKTVHAMSQL